MPDSKHRFMTIDRQKYSIHEDDRKGIQVTSIHPYDETEYHWARLLPGEQDWKIIRDGRVVSVADAFEETGTLRTIQSIAQLLNQMDKDAHLTRRGGIC